MAAAVRNHTAVHYIIPQSPQKVNCAVLDKNVVIKPNKELSGASTCPLFIGKDVTV